MTTHYDVPGEHLVGALANTLKSDDAISPPEWSSFVKTAVHKEKSPSQPDWWYFRTASVLRKIGVNGPIGTERLAKHYSGARDRGAKPNRSEGGSRKALIPLGTIDIFATLLPPGIKCPTIAWPTS